MEMRPSLPGIEPSVTSEESDRGGFGEQGKLTCTCTGFLLKRKEKKRGEGDSE